MPTRGHTRRAFRLDDDDLWEMFRTTTDGAGTDRSAVLRQLVRWYVGEKGVKLPDRPHVEPPRRRKSEPDHG